MRSILISLISLPVFAADNSVEVDTKGSNSNIYIDQIGSSNTARVWSTRYRNQEPATTMPSSTLSVMTQRGQPLSQEQATITLT